MLLLIFVLQLGHFLFLAMAAVRQGPQNTWPHTVEARKEPDWMTSARLSRQTGQWGFRPVEGEEGDSVRSTTSFLFLWAAAPGPGAF